MEQKTEFSLRPGPLKDNLKDPPKYQEHLFCIFSNIGVGNTAHKKYKK